MESAAFEEATPAQPLSVIQAFLDDEEFWKGARFLGLLCDGDGNVIPWEADIIPEDGLRYVLSGEVRFDERPAVSIRSFFELWRNTKPRLPS